MITPICFFFCTVGTAMYCAGDLFGVFIKEYQDYLREEHGDPTHYQNAGYDFVSELVKQMIMPLLIVGLFTISLEAAAVMTLLYIGYNIHQAQSKTPPARVIEPVTADSSLLSCPSCC
jgi:hypothetical protein